MPTSRPHDLTTSRSHVAILAGGGDLPLQIAASITARGGQVHIVAIRGEADARVEAYPHTWTNMAQASRIFAALKPPKDWDGPSVMVIAGAVTRPDLAQLRPDFGFMRVLVQVLGLITAGGDDALLTRAIRIFEREGLTVVGIQDVAPELLIGAGTLGHVSPDDAALADIATGRAVLATLGGLDVGQAIVVEAGRVLAIEGVEGTDRMLTRLASLGAASGKAVLLKAPKPRQERRVDLPTIGVRTVEHAHAAGIRGIAVVAGDAIGLQRDAMITAADAHGLFVVGVAAGRASEAPATPVDAIVAVCGRLRPSKGDLADAQRGADAVLRLTAFDTGSAAAVVRGHVLGIAAAEGPAGLAQRIGGLSQWGLRRLRRKRGALVVRCDQRPAPADLAAWIDRAADAGLAGIGLLLPEPANIPTDVVAHADQRAVVLASIHRR